MKRVALAIAFLCMASASLAQQPAPNVSGSWVLEKSASRLKAFSIDTLDHATLQISQSQGVFTIKRTYVVGGHENTFTFALPLGGKEEVITSDGQTRYARLRSENDALVYEARLAEPSGEFIHVIHYRLTPGGKRLIEHESRKGAESYVNLWVYTRQP